MSRPRVPESSLLLPWRCSSLTWEENSLNETTPQSVRSLLPGCVCSLCPPASVSFCGSLFCWSVVSTLGSSGLAEQFLQWPADSALLTLESITIARCFNPKTLLVRQLPPVFIPACQLPLTDTPVFTQVYGNYSQRDLSLCSQFLRVFCNATRVK